MCFFVIAFFFFQQKTAYEMRISDWSSDVCSSDLAGRVGLDAASARLVEVQERPALPIERYDRVRASDGTRQRLHQEDFCQVLGYPEGLKYEARERKSVV